MAIKAVIGGQWGDEGKGKIVDLLSQDAEIVARYQGGANAGHTVYKDDEKIVLHQIPSGILREDCFCVMGNGMVIDPIELVEEINMLKNKNISTQKILISPHAHIVTPLHKFLDRKNEEKTNNFIGTTCKGIGPCYVDKYNRVGIRAIDIKNQEKLKSIFVDRLNDCTMTSQINDNEYKEIESEIELFFKSCIQIKNYIDDTFNLLFSKNNILIEGAQGTLLDIDHGTYPFVTSSSPFSGGISTGLGIPLTKLENIIGIFKAYATRVGSGPFPTELKNKIGEFLYLHDKYNQGFDQFSDAVGQSVGSRVPGIIDVGKYAKNSPVGRASLFLFETAGAIGSCMYQQQNWLIDNDMFTAENNTIANQYCTNLTWKQFLQDERSNSIDCKYLQYIQFDLK